MPCNGLERVAPVRARTGDRTRARRPRRGIDDWSSEDGSTICGRSRPPPNPRRDREPSRRRTRSHGQPPFARRFRWRRRPAAAREARSRGIDGRRRRRILGLTRLAIAIGLSILIILGVMTLFKTIAAPSLDAMVRRTAPSSARPGSRNSGSRPRARGRPRPPGWSLDGTKVSPRAGKTLIVYRPRDLRDGKHTFEIKATGGFLGASTTKSWTFTVDTKPPKVKLAQPGRLVCVESGRRQGDDQRGRGPAGEPAPRSDEGRHVASQLRTSSRRRFITATDKVGNSSRWRMPITIVPRERSRPRGARERRRLGIVHAPDGVLQMIDDADQRRRARPQGRVRDHRLARARASTATGPCGTSTTSRTRSSSSTPRACA